MSWLNSIQVQNKSHSSDDISSQNLKWVANVRDEHEIELEMGKGRMETCMIELKRLQKDEVAILLARKISRVARISTATNNLLFFQEFNEIFEQVFIKMEKDATSR